MALKATSVLACLAWLSLAFAVAAADRHPAGLRNHRFNGPNNPVTENGVTTFEIREHECSDVKYGDGRGESDCSNGNVRETIGVHESRLDETWTYRFDLKVTSPVTYRGWSNGHARGFLPYGHDSRLRIASWEGNRLHNFIYMLKLDGYRGVTFLDKTCFGPDGFDEWHSFKLETRWTADRRGWVRVSCDDEAIYFSEGAPSRVAPHCYITNQCEPGVKKSPTRFYFLLGPVMSGFGYEWKKYGKRSQFTDFDGPITLSTRNVAIERGGELYDASAKEAVRGLQQHLTMLGCDPGPVDGAMGARTRSAANDCRDFEADAVPEMVNAETVSAWLAAYRKTYPAN